MQDVIEFLEQLKEQQLKIAQIYNGVNRMLWAEKRDAAHYIETLIQKLKQWETSQQKH